MMTRSRVIDIRTYTAAPGKREALKKRFAQHTLGFFDQHGIEVVGFYEPVDDEDTLIYIVSFDSVEAAERAWANFTSDPEWAKAKATTEVDGPLALKVETRRCVATDVVASR